MGDQKEWLVHSHAAEEKFLHWRPGHAGKYHQSLVIWKSSVFCLQWYNNKTHVLRDTISDWTLRLICKVCNKVVCMMHSIMMDTSQRRRDDIRPHLSARKQWSAKALEQFWRFNTAVYKRLPVYVFNIVTKIFIRHFRWIPKLEKQDV